MTIRIESPKYVCEHQGKPIRRPYQSFWVRAFDTKHSIAISGWKFYEDSKTVSSPSTYKGDGKFFNTTRPSSEFFNAVLTEAQRYFEVETPIKEDEEEVTA